MTYADYVAQCTADGIKAISYTAWVNLQPLTEVDL
jgi:hypothetical protein